MVTGEGTGRVRLWLERLRDYLCRWTCESTSAWVTITSGLDLSFFESFGGPEGIRTLDLFHAMEARSQLRHRPTRRVDS
jgi:hypothetical protein